MKYDLTYLQHDAIHCLTPGLFRSIKKGERGNNKNNLYVEYYFGDGKKIEFKGPEPLGADDLLILQGLVAISGPSSGILKEDTKTEKGKELREKLDLEFDAKNKDVLVANGSFRALAREVGYADIDNFKRIRTCIERLWTVSIFLQIGGQRLGFRLLSRYASDEKSGKLCIALNPQITKAILGDTQYVRISMEEIRKLKSDAARLIHQRICAWINPGKSGKIAINILCSYVWPDQAKGQKMSNRKQKVKAALKEFENIGWKYKEYVRDKFEISRAMF